MRQFYYVQSIPAHPDNSWVSFDDVDDRWTHYSDHLVAASEMCLVPGQCAVDYIDWFFNISHPFMIVTQTSDPPREPHIPQVPKAAATSTLVSSDVDEARHAMISVTIWLDVCHLLQLF